jgi:hypothetical protein
MYPHFATYCLYVALFWRSGRDTDCMKTISFYVGKKHLCAAQVLLGQAVREAKGELP